MKTKIICTLGPASSRPETIRAMADAGMSVARLNFSHGSHRDHQKLIDRIRLINAGRKEPIKIMQDLEGYRLRIGQLSRPVMLNPGDWFWMGRPKRACGSREMKGLPLDADVDMSSVKKGMNIFIADGTIALEVAACRHASMVVGQVRQGGRVTSKKGVNIPGLKLKENILTDQDRRDIEFGISNKVDFVAQSFVRNKKDIQRVVNLVKPRLPAARVIAKIENRSGVRNIENIINACDGVMVARGDLGVSLPIYQLPVIQKAIIRLCNKKRKTDITATQMLESMTTHLRPTRAEVSDIANAILDASDYVMLSGETAVGRFPVACVSMMRQIIEFTEQHRRIDISKDF